MGISRSTEALKGRRKFMREFKPLALQARPSL